MFANACSLARQFTWPITVSQRNVKGDCIADIAGIVIVNEEGWFVTAFHIISQLQALDQSFHEFRRLTEERQKLEADPNIKKHDKLRQLNGPLKISDSLVTNYSIWAGRDDVHINKDIFGIPAIDLALGRLDGFDKSMVKSYPQFKDPSRPMDQGTSLCKFGFPFHTIKPEFEHGRFILPPGSLPIPGFPIEGLYTRNITIQGEPAKPYPLMYLETSSPGLRGQSGGPTFDIHGTIWAIQSLTQHLPLGFGTNQSGKEAEFLRNQYLNVGWGIHALTLTSYLKEMNVSFQMSTY